MTEVIVGAEAPTGRSRKLVEGRVIEPDLLGRRRSLYTLE